MAGERFVVLGLAPARSVWFRQVAQWADAGSLPVEFAKCLSAEDLRARLASGRAHSAVLVDAGLPTVDRDLLARARAAGCAVVIVEDPRVRRDWLALGADATLPSAFSPKDLLDALSRRAVTVGRTDSLPGEAVLQEHQAWTGVTVALCGPGGTGTSTLAIALAQTLAHQETGRVALVDAALHAEQAVLHDARELVPGIQEVVEAHRRGNPTAAEVRALTYEVEERGYDLLLGMRRARAWSSLRPRAVLGAIDGLRRAYPWLVIDADADLEGEAECGSIDIEERHALARSSLGRADVVLAVGAPGLKGAHALLRVLGDLVGHGIPGSRIVPVVNRAPRSPRARAELAGALAGLAPPSRGVRPGPWSPVFVPERKVDDAMRDGVRLHPSLGTPLAGAVRAVLRREGERSVAALLGDAAGVAGDQAGGGSATAGAPARVQPGSLGMWAALAGEDEDDGPEAVAG